jgi:uncharacterized protein (TIGR02147 family)
MAQALTIFDFTDYKAYFNSWVEALPKGGRGEYRRLAQALNVSTTMISQVFNGEKHLNLELGSDLADYLHLNELETDYLFLLIENARAGSFRLQQKLKKRISNAQKEAHKLEVRLQENTELSEETKAVFYSSWIYTGVRILTDLEEFNDIQSIAERLNLPRVQVQRVMEFLLKQGLVVQQKGKLAPGPRRTHIGASSPLVAKHHQNWRINGFQKMVLTDTNNFFYTGPMTLSEEVANQIRAEFPSFIERVHKMVMPSKSETVRCLNIDWFEI